MVKTSPQDPIDSSLSMKVFIEIKLHRLDNI